MEKKVVYFDPSDGVIMYKYQSSLFIKWLNSGIEFGILAWRRASRDYSSYCKRILFDSVQME